MSDRLCECGCGKPIRPHRLDKYRDKRFLPGHHTILAAKQGRPHRTYAPRPDEIPSGLCECGCGKRTAIVTHTFRARRHFRGHPYPFAHGHGRRKRRAESHKWKGGRITNAGGYVLVYVPDHPDAGAKGYVFEHRLVMERVLGRRLRRDEHVHHRDGDKQNNEPENLEAMSPEEHARHHDKAGLMRAAQAARRQSA